MDGKYLTGIVTYSARYFFNIDEYMLMQFFVAMVVAIAVYLKPVITAAREISMRLSAAFGSIEKKINTIGYEKLFIHSGRP